MGNIHIENTAIACIHNKLNNIYSLSESVFEAFKSDYDLKVSYGFFTGHYIKINEKYEYQKYPIPVISIEQKGDIGFNINGVWFEFFLDKNSLSKTNIKALIDKHNIEIYGGNDCLVDFYCKDKSIQNIFQDINASNEEIIGISIYLNDFNILNLKDTFFSVCTLLNI